MMIMMIRWYCFDHYSFLYKGPSFAIIAISVTKLHFVPLNIRKFSLLWTWCGRRGAWRYHLVDFWQMAYHPPYHLVIKFHHLVHTISNIFSCGHPSAGSFDRRQLHVVVVKMYAKLYCYLIDIICDLDKYSSLTYTFLLKFQALAFFGSHYQSCTYHIFVKNCEGVLWISHYHSNFVQGT